MQPFTDEELKKKLTPEQYHILREAGTEAPFSGKFLHNKEQGSYVCPACGAVLFKSDTMYQSHIPGLEGWPSFADVAKAGAVVLQPDDSLGMSRTEVLCAKCRSHLGHIFDDAGSPSGQHYCINSAALEFVPKDGSNKI